MPKPKPNRRLPGKDRPKKVRPEGRSSPRTGMARDIGAVVLLALAMASGLALATFSAVDAALLARELAPTNLVGPVGHHLASGLYRALGLAALVLPVALSTAAWRMLRGAPSRLTLLSSASYAVLILSTAALAQLALGGRLALPFPAGGAVGGGLARQCARFLSTWGSGIALTATATVALIVATDLKVRTLGAGLWAAVTGATAFASRRLAAAVDEHGRLADRLQPPLGAGQRDF